ncbi:MAG: MFS transporter [Alphaproteobacteria bacterium]|nr:MFS transporter [Alphaproteobacteria bacterium]
MTPQQALRVIFVGLGTSVVPLDTAVNIAFPDITQSFGLPIESIQWVVICYVLTYASLMLAFGRVGDIFGHGRVFRVGLLWSGTAYLLCAAAPGYGWLLFCRFLQGIGASLVVSCAPAIVTGLFPEDKRTRAVALFTMIYAIGSALGPLLGGVLVHVWGWPAVFWFRAPIAFASLVFPAAFAAPVSRGTREPLDILGAILLALGISTLLLALNQLQHPGRHALLPAAFLTTAAASLFGFVYWERLVAQPIVNLDFFRNARFAAANLASVLIYVASFSVLLFGPYYLVRVEGLSLFAAGAALAASFVGSIVGSPLAGAIIARLSAGRVAALGALLSGTGLVLIGSSGAGAAWWILAVLGALALQGLGVGLFQVAYMDIVMQTLPRRHRGVSGSVAMLSRSLGVVIGATLFTLVFHVIEQYFPGDAFMPGFRATFWLAGVMSAIAGLLLAVTAKARR